MCMEQLSDIWVTVRQSVSVVIMQVSCRCTARSFINVCTHFKGADCQTPRISVYKGGRKL